MRLAAALSTALCALALGGCGNTLQVQPISHNTLEGFVLAPFPVYWLGASFRGLAISEASHDAGDAYSLTYGNCLRGGEGYCVPPLRLVSSPNNSFIPGVSTAITPRRIRGVRALLAQEGKTVIIPTGSVMVDIYADSARLALAAAQTAVPINVPAAPGGALPEPLPDDGFETVPLPAQVPNPLHPPGRPLAQ